MLDFFESIGTTITNIFDFIGTTIQSFIAIRDNVAAFFVTAAKVISILPLSVQAIIYAALALLIAFIVIELLRDFL